MDKVVAIVVAGGVLYLVYKVAKGPAAGFTTAYSRRKDYENRPLYLDKNYRKVPMGTDIIDFMVREQDYYASEAQANPMRLYVQDVTTNPTQYRDIHA